MTLRFFKHISHGYGNASKFPQATGFSHELCLHAPTEESIDQYRHSFHGLVEDEGQRLEAVVGVGVAARLLARQRLLQERHRASCSDTTPQSLAQQNIRTHM